MLVNVVIKSSTTIDEGLTTPALAFRSIQLFKHRSDF